MHPATPCKAIILIVQWERPSVPTPRLTADGFDKPFRPASRASLRIMSWSDLTAILRGTQSSLKEYALAMLYVPGCPPSTLGTIGPRCQIPHVRQLAPAIKAATRKGSRQRRQYAKPKDCGYLPVWVARYLRPKSFSFSRP